MLPDAKMCYGRSAPQLVDHQQVPSNMLLQKQVMICVHVITKKIDSSGGKVFRRIRCVQMQ